MRVKCVICDKIDHIDDHSPLAKRLRNRPIHTYMCDECNQRIADRTNERKATGLFKLKFEQHNDNEW